MDEHNVVKIWLPDFAAGSLSAEEQERVRRHLARCADCSRDSALLQRLVPVFQNLPAPDVNQAVLVRIAAQAAARRMEVIERRRQTFLIIAAALLGWTLVVVSLPLWRWLIEWASAWSGLPINAGLPTAFVLSALFSYLYLPAIWVLLERRRIILEEEEQR
jgi:anti-sigma factor RsiW